MSFIGVADPVWRRKRSHSAGSGKSSIARHWRPRRPSIGVTLQVHVGTQTGIRLHQAHGTLYLANLPGSGPPVVPRGSLRLSTESTIACSIHAKYGRITRLGNLTRGPHMRKPGIRAVNAIGILAQDQPQGG